MDKDQALEHVTEIEVSAGEKRMLEQYEPAEAHVTYTAAVPDGVDPEAVQEALSSKAASDAKRAVLRRWEEYLRKQDDE